MHSTEAGSQPGPAPSLLLASSTATPAYTAPPAFTAPPPARSCYTLPDTAPRHPSRPSQVPINPDFSYVRDGLHVRFANDASGLQTQVSQLISEMYGARGLRPYAIGGAYAPDQVTLAACKGDRLCGTVTLGMDCETGLLADTLYREEIDSVRASGGRVGEVTRLALASDADTLTVMANIFNITFILARQVHQLTDLFVEVHPRHAAFYRRVMGYKVAGPVRTCPRVNAPAVLLHLCLRYVEEQVQRLAGASISGERSLYRMFMPSHEQNLLAKSLTRDPFSR